MALKKLDSVVICFFSCVSLIIQKSDQFDDVHPCHFGHFHFVAHLISIKYILCSGLRIIKIHF